MDTILFLKYFCLSVRVPLMWVLLICSPLFTNAQLIKSKSLDSRDDSIQITIAKRDYKNILRGVRDEQYIGYVFDNTKPNLVFEANVSPDLKLGLVKNVYLQLAFKTNFRMYDTTSNPIRTPTYNPSVTVNYFFNHHAVVYENEPVDFLSLTVAHYSNGQEGDFFNSDGSINYINGNFATNFIELRNTITKSLNGKQRYSKAWCMLSGSLIRNIGTKEGGFSMEEGLKNSYGFSRIKMNARGYRNLNGIRDSSRQWDLMIGTEMMFVLDPAKQLRFFGMTPLERRFSFKLMTELKFPPSYSDFGIYAQFYIGPDYYNIYYSQYYVQFLIGFTANLTQFSIPNDAGRKKK
jgi:hypothetical protein